MTAEEQRRTLAHFDQAIAALTHQCYSLTLFVSGASDSSARAVANVREICDAHLSGRHELNIVDLHQQPDLAEQHNILATPTLVRDQPLPPRMLVGDMSDHVGVLTALEVSIGAPPDRPNAQATPARPRS